MYKEYFFFDLYMFNYPALLQIFYILIPTCGNISRKNCSVTIII